MQTDTNRKPDQMISELLRQFRERIETGAREDDAAYHQKMKAKIRAKLEAGRRLTKKEMEYLSRYDPGLYRQAMRIQQARKALEEQLRHARSKEEVARIELAAYAGVPKDDPLRAQILAALQEAVKEFKESDAYHALPETDEEAAQKKKARKRAREDEEDKDPEELSLSYQEEASGYQIAVAEAAPEGFSAAS